MIEHIGLVALIAGVILFVILVRDPDEEDDEVQDEHATMHGPGLPHSRGKR
jgi:hypothetical protein